jgi:hypothetical protein
MPSYRKVPIFFHGSYRRTHASCRYFNRQFGFQVKNKYHIQSRHLASYLVYGSEGIVQAAVLLHNVDAHNVNVTGRLCYLT